MKRIIALMCVLILVLTGCAPRHSVDVRVTLEEDFSGTLALAMALKAEDLLMSNPNGDETVATLEEVQAVITTLVNESDRLNKDRVQSEIKNQVLYFDYEEDFASIAEFEAIVSKAQGKAYHVDMSSNGSLLSGSIALEDFNVDALSLVSWIYDEILVRESFGTNSDLVKLYLSENTTLSFEGTEVDGWTDFRVEDPIEIESIFMDIDLKADGLFDSVTEIKINKNNITDMEAQEIVKQFHAEASDMRMMGNESYEFGIVQSDDDTTLVLTTVDLGGEDFSEFIKILTDVETSIFYTHSKDTKEVSLQTVVDSRYAKILDHVDEWDLRVHLNDYEISSVDGTKFKGDKHHSFTLKDGVLSDIENYTQFELVAKKPFNLFLTLGLVLVGIAIVIFAFLGIKKTRNANVLKLEKLNQEASVTQVDESVDEKTETPEPEVQDPKESVSPTQFMNLVLDSFKDVNTYLKALIFFVLTVALGAVAMWLSHQVVNDTLDMDSVGSVFAQLTIGFGFASGAGIKVVESIEMIGMKAIFQFPMLIALILAYLGTQIISIKILRGEVKKGVRSLADNLGMSLVFVLVLLVWSYLPMKLEGDIKLTLSQGGILLRLLPLHAILGFVWAYRLEFDTWPIPVEKPILTFISKRMVYILAVSVIVFIYCLVEAGFSVIPFAFNIFAVSGLFAMGGSVSLHIGSIGYNSPMGAILSSEFSLALVVLMLVGIGILVFNVDALYREVKGSKPLKFTVVFAGLVVGVYGIFAYFSSLTMTISNLGESRWIGLRMNYVSLLVSFALVALPTYLQITLLSGVDLSAKLKGLFKSSSEVMTHDPENQKEEQLDDAGLVSELEESKVDVSSEDPESEL